MLWLFKTFVRENPLYRVTSQFELANEKKMVLEEGEVTTDMLCKHLDESGPVILLINNALLTCGYQDCRKYNRYRGYTIHSV